MTGLSDGGDVVSYRRPPPIAHHQEMRAGELELASARAPGRYVASEAEPVNKTTLAVMALALTLGAVIVIVIASLVFVSCTTKPVIPPQPNVHNPNCTSWCLG